MKIIHINILILMSTFIFGCSSHKNYVDKGWFNKADSGVSAANILNNARYKMIYIDVSNNKKLELEQDIQKFGNNLERYGEIIELSYLPKVEQKVFLSEVLIKLGKNYEYYESPFLIFFTGSTLEKNFKPYDILSLGGINRKCIKNSLNRMEHNIHKKSIDVFSDTEFYKLKGCSAYNNNKQYAYKAFELLTQLLIKSKK